MIPLFIFLWLGIAYTEAGPLRFLTVRDTPSLYIRQITNSSSVNVDLPLPSNSSAPTNATEIVPASGNNSTETDPQPFASLLAAAAAAVLSSTQASQTLAIPSPFTTSRAVLQFASIGNALNQTIQTVAAVSKQIGIIQAIPNNPGQSPDLTSIPPINPSQLSVASAILAALQTSNGTASATSLSRPSAGFIAAEGLSSGSASSSSSSAIPAAAAPGADQTSIGLVTSTSFPLLLGSNPQPAATITSPVAGATITPESSSASASLSSSSDALPAIIPMISSLSAISTTTRSPDDDSSGDKETSKKPHHHHKSRSSRASVAAAAASPSLIIPNPSAVTISVITTLTVPAPSDLQIVPINIPTTVQNNNDGVTVTITVTVAQTTITASFLSISTLTVTA